MLGSKYPIIQGAYDGFGTSAIAAPVSQAGGFGLITAHCFRTPERLRADIEKARGMTDQPFGVNLSVGLVSSIDEMLQLVIEERIPVVETSIFPAGKYGKKLKEAGIKWIHKVASVEHAVAAERQGADAVVIVGLGGYAFKTMSQLPTLVAIAWAARQIKVPIIAAGGIGDARTFAAALCLGAEGVTIGTAFMATKECPISDERKLALVQASPTDPGFHRVSLWLPNQEDYEKVMKERDSLPLETWLRRLEKVMLFAQSPDEPMPAGHTKGSLAVAFIDRIVSVQELIDNIVTGAEEILRGGLPATTW
jgi:nitronate monooxygenase